MIKCTHVVLPWSNLLLKDIRLHQVFAVCVQASLDYWTDPKAFTRAGYDQHSTDSMSEHTSPPPDSQCLKRIRTVGSETKELEVYISGKRHWSTPPPIQMGWPSAVHGKSWHVRGSAFKEGALWPAQTRHQHQKHFTATRSPLQIDTHAIHCRLKWQKLILNFTLTWTYKSKWKKILIFKKLEELLKNTTLIPITNHCLLLRRCTVWLLFNRRVTEVQWAEILTKEFLKFNMRPDYSFPWTTLFPQLKPHWLPPN